MEKVLSTVEITQRLGAFPGWQLGEDGQLHCLKQFKDFSHALLFLNTVGLLAEIANHHPDLYLHSYKKLMISVMSHDLKGITEKDFALIVAIEALPIPG